MVFLSTLASAVIGAALVSAQHDPGAALDKPPLRDNTNSFSKGYFDNLPETGFELRPWIEGWVPQGCIDVAIGKVSKDVNFNPKDIRTFSVHYDDCKEDPWIFCHHKDSPASIESVARQFGRVPIQMRQYVRHVSDYPEAPPYAFEYDASVNFFRPSDDMLQVMIHEVAHSLDFYGAYEDKPMSASDRFWNAYNADQNTPNRYSQTAMAENVAENTMIALYNEIVPGGFGTIEPEWQKIYNQYRTIQEEGAKSGKGNSIFRPGSGEACTHKVPSSEPVNLNANAKSRIKRLVSARGRPNVTLSRNVVPIEVRTDENSHHTHCKLEGHDTYR